MQLNLRKFNLDPSITRISSHVIKKNKTNEVKKKEETKNPLKIKVKTVLSLCSRPKEQRDLNEEKINHIPREMVKQFSCIWSKRTHSNFFYSRLLQSWKVLPTNHNIFNRISNKEPNAKIKKFYTCECLLP